MLDEKKGYVMYRSFIKAIRGLDADDFKECVLAVSDYALDGIEYEGDNSIVNMFMELVKPQIDANNSRYENGKKGGRPKKATQTETEPKAEEKQTKPKEPKVIEELADVESIPLNNGTEWKPTVNQYAEYCRLYPNVNVEQEFRNMRGWCLGNPSRKKTPSGVKRFVTNWLSDEQNKGIKKNPSIQIGMPTYMHSQLNGSLPKSKPATQETLEAVKKMQEGMNKC